MKKLALLLAALSVASVSYAKEVMPEAAPVVEEVVVEEVVEVKAAPVLRVTSIGQYLEIDNTSGNEDVGEAVHFANKVGLALGDNWAFDLMARKTWSASVDDYYDNDTKGSGMKSAGHRIDLQATRLFENFSVGLRWRGEKEQDAIFLPVTYNYGMFSGWIEPAYYFANVDKGQDYFYVEAEPVQLSYGPVQLAYYVEGYEYTGDGDEFAEVKGLNVLKESEWAHQVRLRTKLYSTDNFRLGAEYRYQFAGEIKGMVEPNVEGTLENNRHIAILNAAYDVTENLTIDGYYRYDFNKYDAEIGNQSVSVDDDYYGEFYVGWTYRF